MTAGGGSTKAPTAAETASNLKRLLLKRRKSKPSSSRASKSPPLSERDDAARLDELRRTFGTLIDRGELVLSHSSSSSSASPGGDLDSASATSNKSADVKAKWNSFLRKKHDEFVLQLCDGVKGGRKTALRTFCGVIASSPRTLAGEGRVAADAPPKMIDERLLYRLVESIANPSGEVDSSSSTDESLLNLFDAEFVKPHRDVQYFVLHAVRKLASELYAKTEKKAKKAAADSRKGEEHGTDDEDINEEDVIVGVRAENLMRILLRINSIAESNADLADVGAYLIPPPDGAAAAGANADSDGGDDEDDDDDDDDDDRVGQDDDDDSESASESDDDSEDDDGAQTRKKRKRNGDNDADSSSKRSKKSQQQNRCSWQQVGKHRRALQESWLSVLKISHLPNRALKRALQHLPTHVLPSVPAPLRFADFCTRSYEYGSVTSLLALHSLFILMTQHGLEYPKFYASLYRLIERRNFYAKHRTRFFRLLNLCLTTSDMLPAYSVAAFCKRLCRCAMSVPPSGSLFVLALVSNLLRKHGECACLIHRGGGRGGGGETEDGFDAEAEDPATARALESSLWELDALERHYHPAVAALAKSVGIEGDKAPMHDMDEFLLHTYKSLFEQERKRGEQKKKRKAVPLTFVKPKGLFTKDDVFRDILALPPKQSPKEP